jgi:hypothetical protein
MDEPDVKRQKKKLNNSFDIYKNRNKRTKYKMKRLKPGESIEDLKKNWTQCLCYLPKKFRFCNIARDIGSKYCGLHRSEYEGTGKKSMPCPIDPTHTILVCNLKKHLKVCTAQKILNKLEMQPYYKKNVNSGGHRSTAGVVAGAVDPDALATQLESLANLLIPLPYTQPQSKPTYMQEIIATLAGKQTSANRVRHAEQDAQLVELMDRHGLLSMPCTTTSVEIKTGSAAEMETDTCTQELKQNQQSTSYKDVFVELGAGKGLLGLAVVTASESVDLVLVERGGGYQGKVDKHVRAKFEAEEKEKEEKEEGNNRSPSRMRRRRRREFTRITMDLRDCVVTEVTSCSSSSDNYSDSRKSDTKTNQYGNDIKDREADRDHDHHSVRDEYRVVLGAKHLCGVASDLAIKSVESSSGIVEAESTPVHLKGIAIATCCHHACVWDDYVGRDYLLQYGIDAAQFEVLKGWSSWCTSLRMHTNAYSTTNADVRANTSETTNIANDSANTKKNTEDNKKDKYKEVQKNIKGGEEQHQMPQEIKSLASRTRPSSSHPSRLRQLGWLAKRLLDEGRAVYLRQQGYRVTQCIYTDSETTPECCVLIAVNNGK